MSGLAGCAAAFRLADKNLSWDCCQSFCVSNLLVCVVSVFSNSQKHALLHAQNSWDRFWIQRDPEQETGEQMNEKVFPCVKVLYYKTVILIIYCGCPAAGSHCDPGSIPRQGTNPATEGLTFSAGSKPG